MRLLIFVTSDAFDTFFVAPFLLLIDASLDFFAFLAFLGSDG